MIREPTGWVANCENCWKEISSDRVVESDEKRNIHG